MFHLYFDNFVIRLCRIPLNKSISLKESSLFTVIRTFQVLPLAHARVISFNFMRKKEIERRQNAKCESKKIKHETSIRMPNLCQHQPRKHRLYDALKLIQVEWIWLRLPKMTNLFYRHSMTWNPWNECKSIRQHWSVMSLCALPDKWCDTHAHKIVNNSVPWNLSAVRNKNEGNHLHFTSNIHLARWTQKKRNSSSFFCIQTMSSGHEHKNSKLFEFPYHIVVGRWIWCLQRMAALQKCWHENPLNCFEFHCRKKKNEINNKKKQKNSRSHTRSESKETKMEKILQSRQLEM